MNSILAGNDASSRFDWSVAVIAAREEPKELMATIASIVRTATRPTIIDVLVNGNPTLAAEVARLLGLIEIPPDKRIRVWAIPLGGKAHAWNQYVHRVWPRSKLAFFVDGYVIVDPKAFQLLATGMESAPHALAGTGLPSSGRTASKLAETTMRDGALHGNLFALTGAAMREFRERGFRLPLGLYGFDTLLGAVLGFGLDPSKNEWNAKSRILALPGVTWTNDEKKWWRYSDVKTQFQRTLNNGLRVLVRRATIDFLAHRKLPPETLHRTVEEFVLAWVRACPREARATLLASPLSWIALRKLRKPRDWSAAEHSPRLLYTNEIPPRTDSLGGQPHDER